MEALLRRTRGPEPSGAVERRVVDAVRRPRRTSRILAAAAIVLFALVLAAVLRTEPTATPGGSKGRIRYWGQVVSEGNQVVAALSADEAVMVDGTAKVRVLTAKLFPSKGPAVTIRAESGRFDLKGSRIVFDGIVRITRDDGFDAEVSAATADLREKTWTATFDLAARYAKTTNQKPETCQPKTEISAKSGVSSEEEMTFEQPTLTLSCAGWTFRAAGRSGRANRPDPAVWRIVDGVVATFEDGRKVEAAEAVVTPADRTVRLTATFK
jgi:hypothetical protein